MMPESKKPVTIESLLHLKRSERPPAEFWTQFEGELRAKQLAAIVGPRPWYSWANVRRLGAVLPVSVGTAAAVGAALFSVHEFRGSSASPAASAPIPRAVSVAMVAPGAVKSSASGAALAAVSTAPRAVVTAAQRVRANGAGSVSNASAAVVLTAMPARPAFPDPFTGVVAVSNPAAELPVTMTATTMAGAAQWSPASYVDHSAQTEPLARTMTFADERRAALLSDPLPNSSAAWASASASDQHEVSELSEERLYQAVRRLGVGGDRLLIRF